VYINVLISFAHTKCSKTFPETIEKQESIYTVVLITTVRPNTTRWPSR